MNRFRAAHLTAATAVCAALYAPSALAGGEPKNVRPFTRPAAVPVAARLAGALRRATRLSSLPGIGEDKSGPPFNAVVR
jgi:hypothetical protein